MKVVCAKIKIGLCIWLFIFSLLSSCVYASNYQYVYQQAWKTVESSYYDKTTNNQNWEKWQNRYEDKINNEDDLKVAIDSMLMSLDDIYTYYLTKDQTQQEKQFVADDNSVIYTEPLYFKTKIPKNIKYFGIKTFSNKNLAQDVKNFIQDAEKNPELKGYIIDIRDNYGGMVINAAKIASYFMSEKIMFYGETNNQKVKNTTDKDSLLTTKPLVILINDSSASASEIFAGALQDNSRATVVGTNSFGKGVIQRVVDLSDESALHVTVIKYFTPNMNEINKVGITPDIFVPFKKMDLLFRKDPQLVRAIKYLKKI